MNYKINFRSQDYLEHHGILGQRWGHRNGPPYPLDSEDHSSSEKKAGWKKSLKGETATSLQNDTLSKAYKVLSEKSSKKHPHISKAADDMSKDYANKAEKSRLKYALEKESFKQTVNKVSNKINEAKTNIKDKTKDKNKVVGNAISKIAEKEEDRSFRNDDNWMAKQSFYRKLEELGNDISEGKPVTLDRIIDDYYSAKDDYDFFNQSVDDIWKRL